jgi:hypothetical protein
VHVLNSFQDESLAVPAHVRYIVLIILSILVLIWLEQVSLLLLLDVQSLAVPNHVLLDNFHDGLSFQVFHVML